MLARRTLLGAAAAGLAWRDCPAAAADPDITSFKLPPPAQPPARSDYAAAPGAFLYFRDTQGAGPAVVFLHPVSGGVDSWTWQAPAFAAAGFRVIVYARRGFAPTQITDPSQHPTENEDLLTLLQALDLKRVHLVGAAAGGVVAARFAAIHTDRVLSLVLCGSQIAPDDDLVKSAIATLVPPTIATLPGPLAELGPDYRAANPDGVARWLAIAQAARAGQPQPRSLFNGSAPSHLSDLPDAVPKLLLTGDADLFMPPVLLAQVAQQLKNATLGVIPGAGHAAFWEQPAVFNAVVIDFLRRHASR